MRKTLIAERRRKKHSFFKGGLGKREGGIKERGRKRKETSRKFYRKEFIAFLIDRSETLIKSSRSSAGTLCYPPLYSKSPTC